MRLRLGALAVFVAMTATPLAGLVCAWTCAIADAESGDGRYAEATCHRPGGHATVAGTVIGAACCHDTALVAPAVAPDVRNVLPPPALLHGPTWAPRPSTPSVSPAGVSWSVCSGDPPGACRVPVLRV